MYTAQSQNTHTGVDIGFFFPEGQECLWPADSIASGSFISVEDYISTTRVPDGDRLSFVQSGNQFEGISDDQLGSHPGSAVGVDSTLDPLMEPHEGRNNGIASCLASLSHNQSMHTTSVLDTSQGTANSRGSTKSSRLPMKLHRDSADTLKKLCRRMLMERMLQEPHSDSLLEKLQEFLAKVDKVLGDLRGCIACRAISSRILCWFEFLCIALSRLLPDFVQRKGLHLDFCHELTKSMNNRKEADIRAGLKECS